MKLRIKTLLTILLISIGGLAKGDEALKANIQKIAQELESRQPGRTKVRVAILEFRTTDNRITPFNSYIQDQLGQAYRNSNRFDVIDQNAINRILKDFGWSLDKTNDFMNYADLSEKIHRELGMVPNAFIYGQINDNNETINLTGYLIPNGVRSSNINSSQVFASSAVTDRLLGKPVRRPEPKPEPKVVYVEREVPVYKEVIVEKEVVVEKEVEVPVYIEKPTKHPRDRQSDFTGTVGDMEFELTEAKALGDRVEVSITIVNNKMDDRIESIQSRFIDPDGNEFNSNIHSNTLRRRDLIEAIPIRGTITFRGNNIQRTQNMAVIEINVYGTGHRNLLGTLRFRNVPVTR